MAREISVVIPVYNGREVIAETLEGLANQRCSLGSFEVVVIDDCGNDDSIDICEAISRTSPYELKMVRHTENRGTYAAYNTGVANSTGPLILLLDQDCVPHPDLVERHLAAHQRRPEPVAVVGQFIWHDRVSWKPYLHYFRPNPLTPSLSDADDLDDLEVSQFISGNCSLPREQLVGLGAFDEGFTFGCGDNDLGYRWHKAGYRIVGEPGARIYHYRPLSFVQLLERKHRIGLAGPYLCRKHPEAAAARGIEHAARRDDVMALYQAVLEFFYHAGVRHSLGADNGADDALLQAFRAVDWESLSGVPSAV